MLSTVLYILFALIFLNVILLLFSCNTPDEETTKSYRLKIKLPKQKVPSNGKAYHLAADK